MTERREWTAKEIRKDRVLANFRPSPEERHARKPYPQNRRRSGHAPDHLALIRQLPCLCGKDCPRPVHAHHLRHGPAAGQRGLGLKPSDHETVPLCWHHHEDCHRTGGKFEAQWFARYGLAPISLANALRANTGDLPSMFAVVNAHKRSAIAFLKRAKIVNALITRGMTRAEAEDQYDTGRGRLR